jgi:hypothetical protein
VSFALIAEQATFVNEMLTRHRRELASALNMQVENQLASGVKELLVLADVLALGRDLQTRQVRTILTDFGALLQPIGSLAEPLRSGVVAWMRGSPLETYRQSSVDLLGAGVSASLSQHVAVSRAIFATCHSSYLQINQSAYDPTHEWSREWKEFLRSAEPGDRTFEYVVLGTQQYFVESRTKLRAMQSELRKCGGELFVCDRQLVRDSIGEFDLSVNVEVFDEMVVKSQSLNQNGYRGGITLVMSLRSVEQSSEILRVIRAVKESRVVYKSGTKS